MTNAEELRARYHARVDDFTLDAGARAVARAQLERLDRPRRPTVTDGARQPSRWVHVPLAELFAEAGNTITARANGTLESGHEPVHSSRSGRCLVIWPASGRWYCRSCRATGDAVTLVMAMYGWRYPQAAAWLEDRYGPPATSTHNSDHRPLRRTQRALHIREST